MKKYDLLLNACTDSPETMTASQVETMFLFAENANYKLKSVKNYLHALPLKDYTKNRVDDIYNDFMEERK